MEKKSMRVFLMIGVMMSCACIIHAQTVLSNKDIQIDIYDLNQLGKELSIKHKSGRGLPAGNYLYNYSEAEKLYPISFTIDSFGKVHGKIECQGSFTTFVKHGIIYKYQIQQGTGQLVEEGYMKGDTVIKVHYNKHGQKRAEYHYLNGEKVYDYNCSYSEETDSLSTCTMRDEINGVYIFYYAGGVIESKRATKNLPEGIKEVYEEFDRKGNRNFIEITYTSGDQKRVYPNGNYEIVNNEIVKSYNKDGKLIEIYDLYAQPAPPSNAK